MSGSFQRGADAPSAFLKDTVLPHHDWIFESPMFPFRGYCRLSNNYDNEDVNCALRQACLRTKSTRGACQLRCPHQARQTTHLQRATLKGHWAIRTHSEIEVQYGTAKERSGRTIIFGPKREIPPAQKTLKDEPHQRPGHVVHRSRRRDEANSCEHQSDRRDQTRQ